MIPDAMIPDAMIVAAVVLDEGTLEAVMLAGRVVDVETSPN